MEYTLDMDPANIDLSIALQFVRYLQKNDIDPILYVSLGVSIYLGSFKSFGDIDLLISPAWLDARWPDLQAIMGAKGFRLIDEHEHEFQNITGLCVAFAPETVLLRDGILDSLDEVIGINLNDCNIKTLTPEQFKRAYIFSEKDGYRKNTRGKKDQEIIQLLEAYIAS